MSVLARRARDDELERHRALLAMRDSVVSATAAQLPKGGSSATFEAVDDALEQLLDAGAHVGDLALVKARWITWAKRRLIDTHRSAEFKLREVAPVDQHEQALAHRADEDPLAGGEDTRQWWRLQEILQSLSGPQREWAQAWLAQVSGSLAAGAQPRGLHEELGWPVAKTKKTAQRARRKMAAFIEQRSSGEVCSDRQALMDAFISATAAAGARRRAGADLDDQRYEAVLLHIAGCEDCFGAWRTRRRALPSRCGAIFMFPLDSLAATGQAIAGKLAGLLSGVQQTTVSLLGRVGLGGGATAAAGGSAAAISTKTAAVCVGVVCAAGAGVGEIAGVLPPIARKDPPPQRQEAIRKPPPAPAVQPTASSPSRAASASTRPSLSTSHTTTTSSTTRSTPAVTRTTALPRRRITPGDLPTASTSPGPSSPTSTPASNAARSNQIERAAADTPSCIPGDLGC